MAGFTRRRKGDIVVQSLRPRDETETNRGVGDVMATATWEEAIRCPKCDQPGNDTGSVSDGLGGRIHSIVCENQGCAWFDTNWAIQILSDGTIPIREHAERQPKVFPKDGSMTPEKAARTVEAIQDTEDA